MPTNLFRHTLLLLLLTLLNNLQAQNCDPDTDPPVLVCKTAYTVAIPPFGGPVEVPASALDAGSYDLCCTAVSFLAARAADGPCDADNLPDPFSSTLSFCCDEADSTFAVTLQVSDCNGNSGTCTVAITVEDKTPPVAVCDALTFVSLGADGTAEVNAQTFDDGSYDNCCGVSFQVRKQQDGPCDTDNLPDDFGDSVTFCCAEIGDSVNITLRVSDCRGQTTDCITEVIVQDKIKPVCIAPANVTVSCENYDPSFFAYGTVQPFDNCCIDTLTQQNDLSQFNENCLQGVIKRNFNIVDCSGNTAKCTQTITVNYTQAYFVKFPNDVITTDCDLQSSYGEPIFFGEDCELLATAYSDVVYNNVPGMLYRIERTWSIINWCSFNPALPFTLVPNPNPNATWNHPANLPGPVVSAPGTAAPWNPTIVKIQPGDPSPTDFSSFYSANTNGYTYTQIISVLAPSGNAVSGKVFADTMQNCSYDSNEMPLKNWKVKMTGNTTGREYLTVSDSAGNFLQYICPGDTAVTVSLIVPFNYGQNCSSTYTVNLEPNQTVVQDIPVALSTLCPLLMVDIAAPVMRRCFPGYYTIKACNLSTETVEDVHVEVQLDPYLSYTSSGIPGTDLGNNRWSFQLGDLGAGVCTDFKLYFALDCAAPPGATHCSEAHIYPDTLCPTSVNWSGADVRVTGSCDGDSVRLEIRNQGSGNMQQTLDFIVVEDVIMYQMGGFQLNAGETFHLAVPANGATWRLEAEQEPFHPYGGPESATIEGCTSINQPGLVTQLPFSSPNPFLDSDCRQNTGSYDPNDKTAFPSGFGADHLLEANRSIEYQIRFQNTGTDTAFNVVVVDTLSEYLDPRSVRPGASSHPFYFNIVDGNVLRFHFDNIMLPDSNVNKAGSQGFFNFSAAQKPDNPNGTRIENTAHIYFDFNDPIATNTVFHTIGEHFIVLKNEEAAGLQPVSIYPNPSTESAVLQLPAELPQARFELFDGTGLRMQEAGFSGRQYRFERGKLPAGIYYFRISLPDRIYAAGKLMLR